MTSQRRDGHSTEFGIWLRNQEQISSDLGYLATNVDFHWRCWKQGDKWLLLEEKRRGKQPKPWQLESFRQLDTCAISDHKYYGFHLLVFENTNPDDGKMWLNSKMIGKSALIRFLKFDFPREKYLTSKLFKQAE